MEERKTDLKRNNEMRISLVVAEHTNQVLSCTIVEAVESDKEKLSSIKTLNRVEFKHFGRMGPYAFDINNGVMLIWMDLSGYKVNQPILVEWVDKGEGNSWYLGGFGCGYSGAVRFLGMPNGPRSSQF